jgi:DNA repair exonuclease SbcCD nuclease subunit
MSYRLLHLADLHLDRAFAAMGCHGELARRRRHGLRDALRRAGEMALQQRCDAVTIAGDLYEHERAGVDTARFLADTFAGWRPMRVFIAPGNHDALMPGSLYRRAEWSSNVHVFTKPCLVPLEIDDGLTLWGLAHREPVWQGDPLACEPVSAFSGVHIALFHGAELGSRPEGKSIHGPFHAADIRRRGFAVALSGHYHNRRVDPGAGLLYPGSPEPLTFDEAGARGPVVVDVDTTGNVTFTPLDANRWWTATTTCDVGECRSLSSVLDCAAAACSGVVAGGPSQRTLVRVDLTGELESTVSIDLATVEMVLREQCDVAAVSVRDFTVPGVDLDVAESEHSTRGVFIRAAREAIDGARDEREAETMREALRYGLAALAGVEVGLR